MSEDKRWVDPRDSEDEASLPTTGLGPSFQNGGKSVSSQAKDYLSLPKISFSISCTDRFHEFEEWLFQITVRYTRGASDYPIFMKSKDLYRPLIRPLIRNEEMLTNLDSHDLEESKWFDPKFDHHLTQKAHDHLVRTNQWKDKVNMECKCGENIPFKNLEAFLSLVKIALDKRLDEEFGFVPLQFFHFRKPPPK